MGITKQSDETDIDFCSEINNGAGCLKKETVLIILHVRGSVAVWEERLCYRC